MDEPSKSPEKKIGDIDIPKWVKISVIISGMIIALAFAGVIVIKIYESTFQFDFSSFLSILLAFFSIGLSALFYFKASETSNKFYDNTYKFNQSVSNLLSAMDSGFNEKLQNLVNIGMITQNKIDKSISFDKNQNDIENTITDVVSKIKESSLDEEIKQQIDNAMKEYDRRKKDIEKSFNLLDFENDPYSKDVLMTLNPEFIKNASINELKDRFDELYSSGNISKARSIILRMNGIKGTNNKLTDRAASELIKWAKEHY